MDAMFFLRSQVQAPKTFVELAKKEKNSKIKELQGKRDIIGRLLYLADIEMK